MKLFNWLGTFFVSCILSSLAVILLAYANYDGHTLFPGLELFFWFLFVGIPLFGTLIVYINPGGDKHFLKENFSPLLLVLVIITIIVLVNFFT